VCARRSHGRGAAWRGGGASADAAGDDSGRGTVFILQSVGPEFLEFYVPDL